MAKLEAELVDACEYAVPNAVTAECQKISVERAG
jgi:hypothetical protein